MDENEALRSSVKRLGVRELQPLLDTSAKSVFDFDERLSASNGKD